MTVNEIPPSILLIIGALFVPLFKGVWKKVYLLSLPLVALFIFWNLAPGTYWEFSFLNMPIVLGRIDKISTAFGLIFLLITFAGILFIIHQREQLEFISGLFYAGSAVGAVLAGDLFSFLVFWEMLTIGSMFLILSGRTEESTKSAFRYVLFHVFGGLLLISGIILRIHETGSFEFGQIGLSSLSTYLIFLGMGVNCAWPLLHTWLVDAYPSSSYGGVVFLSSFTTKTAVYALARAFPGESSLIWIGVVLAVFPVFYALIENNLRKVLAYSLLNQLGFMVVGIGIGTPLALNGVVAHAICHILYKGLLWMSVGAVFFRTGYTKYTDLGGLFRYMPWTSLFCIIGAFSISGSPLTNGFVSKSLTMTASLESHYYIVWLSLLFTVAADFLIIGIKLPYFTFFSTKRDWKVTEVSKNMIAAMSVVAFFCIFVGCFPQYLYKLLPNVVEYHPYTYDHTISQLQLMFFTALGFLILVRMKIFPAEIRAINLDFDWFYRKGAYLFYELMALVLNGINSIADKIIARDCPSALSGAFKNFAGLFTAKFLAMVWVIFGIPRSHILQMQQNVMSRMEHGTVSVGFSALGVLLVLCLCIGW